MTWLLRWLGLESGTRAARIIESGWSIHPLAQPWMIYGTLAVVVVVAAFSLLPGLAMRRRVRVYTCLLRLLMGALILASLTGLTWQIRLVIEDRPQWVVLVDDSGSMHVRDVPAGSRFDAALADLARIRRTLGQRVDLTVETFSGRGLADEAGMGPTHFQEAVSRAALSRGRPDALLVLTDGRDSEGRNLHDLGADLRMREIAMGARVYGLDAAPVHIGVQAQPDRTVIRLGEEIRIQGVLLGDPALADRSVRITEDGREIRRLSVIAADGGRFDLRHKPERAGRRVYQVEQDGGDPAAHRTTARFVVDVVEEKINVLLLEGYPRFEFKIVKSVLEVDPMVNLVSVTHIPGGGIYVQGEPLHENPEQGLIASQADVFKYDVIILQDVPRRLFRVGGDTTESRLQHLVQFALKRGGGLFVKGGQDVFRAGAYENSVLAPILPFDLSDAYSSQPQFDGMFFVNIEPDAYRHPLLRLLPDATENRTRLDALRELDGANNVGRLKPMAVPLMTRTWQPPAGGAPREIPILAEMAVGEGRVLAAAVDTMWRWQLQPDFDDPPLTMLLANAVRYLAPPPGQRPGEPIVNLPEGIPQVGQDVLLTTELRDRNYDPIRQAALEVTVTQPDGSESRILPRDLIEEPGVYRYRVAVESPGLYQVTARFGRHVSTREFYAGEAGGEFADLTSDRPAMEQFAAAAGGQVIDDLDSWLARADLRRALRVVDRGMAVWNSTLALVLFLGLVSLDCWIRKRNGLA